MEFVISTSFQKCLSWLKLSNVNFSYLKSSMLIETYFDSREWNCRLQTLKEMGKLELVIWPDFRAKAVKIPLVLSKGNLAVHGKQ